MFVLSFFLLLAVRDISADTGSLNCSVSYCETLGQSDLCYTESISGLCAKLFQNCTECSDSKVVICVSQEKSPTVHNNQSYSQENGTEENESIQESLVTKLVNIVKEPQVIIAFLTGVMLSATVCCLATLCQRKKQKNRENGRNMVETLEMVTTEADSLIDPSKSMGTCDQGAAEAGSAAAGQSEPKEAEYSDIDFSRWSRKNPLRAEETQEAKETEYAEIKRDQKEDRQDDGGEDGEKLEGGEQEMPMMEEEEEKRQCGSAEEDKGKEPADGATFSDMNDVTEDLT